MPAFVAMRFMPLQGPTHGYGRTTTLRAMDQRRRYRRLRPVQRMSTSPAFRLTPGQLWSTDTPSTTRIFGVRDGAPGRARSHSSHGCVGGGTHALAVLRR
jgi:hypothetical protein